MKQLENYILSETRKILKEEMGISQIVNDETNRIVEILNEVLKNKNNYHQFYWNPHDKNTLTYGIQSEQEITLFGYYTITLLFKICVIDSSKAMDYAYEHFKNLEKYAFVSETDTIYLHCPAYRPNFDYSNGTIQIGREYTRFRGTLSHEVKHAYQFFQKHIENFKEREDMNYNLLAHDDSKVYRKVLKSIDRYKDCCPQISLIAHSIYYTFPIEITANVQKLWTLIQQDSFGYYDVALSELENSKYVEMIYTIKYCIRLLEDSDNAMDDKTYTFLIVFSHYLGRSKEWIIKHLTKGYKKLLQGYGRVRTMIEKYYDKNNVLPPEDDEPTE